MAQLFGHMDTERYALADLSREMRSLFGDIRFTIEAYGQQIVAQERHVGGVFLRQGQLFRFRRDLVKTQSGNGRQLLRRVRRVLPGGNGFLAAADSGSFFSAPAGSDFWKAALPGTSSWKFAAASSSPGSRWKPGTLPKTRRTRYPPPFGGSWSVASGAGRRS